MITILLNDLKSSKQVSALIAPSSPPAESGPGGGTPIWKSILEPHVMLIGGAQAQVAGPAPDLPDLSLWQILLDNPTFVAIDLVPIAILVTVVVIVRRRYARFFGIQRESLDHRKAADAQALAQNQSTEELIARQYGVINAHNQQIAARADEALRISSETLAQISTMNQSLARIVDRLDRITGPAA